MQLREFGSTGVSVSPDRVRRDADHAPTAGGTSSALLHALERGVYDDRHGAKLRRERGHRRANVAGVARPAAVRRHEGEAEGRQPTGASTCRCRSSSREPASSTPWRPACARSGVECIDLLQIHQWYYRWSHETEWLEALHALRAAGKIRFIGVSAQDHEHDGVLKLVDDRMVDAVQVVLNAFESRPFVSVVPLAEARGVGVIARCVFDHSAALAGVATRASLAHDVKLANASPEIVTEYLRRVSPA